jgi:hypothetical protein
MGTLDLLKHFKFQIVLVLGRTVLTGIERALAQAYERLFADSRFDGWQIETALGTFDVASA